MENKAELSVNNTQNECGQTSSLNPRAYSRTVIKIFPKTRSYEAASAFQLEARRTLSEIFPNEKSVAERPVRYEAPAREYQERFGFEGVSRDWNMPRGLTPQGAQEAMKGTLDCLICADDAQLNGEPIDYKTAAAVIHVSAFYRELCKLNPDFSLPPDMTADPKLLSHAIYGAISQFNMSDIVAYCATRRDPSLRETYEDYQYDPMGQRFGWLVSDETYQAIMNQWDECIESPTRSFRKEGVTANSCVFA
ncbi:MAG: hypothetical protein PHE27_02270 [Alphaproteobacteria bacterium]|nr:hypothetical protein [Alphaproteobacteria bacterium]